MLILVGYISCYLLSLAWGYVLHKTKSKIVIMTKLALQKRVLRNYLFGTNERYRELSAVEMKMRIEDDVSSVQRIVIDYFLEDICMLMKVCGLVTILFWLNSKLGIVGIAFLPISFAFSIICSQKANKYTENLRVCQERCSNVLNESLFNWKVIKTDNLVQRQVDIYTQMCKEKSHNFSLCQLCWFINKAFIGIKDQLVARINILLLGGIMVISGHYEIGSLLVFIEYFLELLSCCSILSNSMVHFQECKQRVDRVISIAKENFHPKYGERSRKFSQICINNAKYSYSTREDFVFCIDKLSIYNGEIIKISGKNGAGKTTLARIISGTSNIHSGEVFIDSKKSRFEDLRKIAIYVPQNPVFFNLTIRENFLLACEHVSDDEIYTALGDVELREFVDNLPNGLDTVIGEKGIKLSGGQKQRLAIARVLLLHPQLIILDEAMNSIDEHMARRIWKRIVGRLIESTFLIISHIDEEYVNYSKRIVIDNGKILSCT